MLPAHLPGPAPPSHSITGDLLLGQAHGICIQHGLNSRSSSLPALLQLLFLAQFVGVLTVTPLSRSHLAPAARGLAWWAELDHASDVVRGRP
jgi:hypothetical protein